METAPAAPSGPQQQLPGLWRSWDALRGVWGSPGRPGGRAAREKPREVPRGSWPRPAFPGALVKMEPAVPRRRGGEERGAEGGEGCAGELVTVCSEECNCPCDRGRRGRGARPASSLPLRRGAELAFGWEGARHLEGPADSARAEAAPSPGRPDSGPRRSRLGPRPSAEANSFGPQALPGTSLPRPRGAPRPGPGAVSCGPGDVVHWRAAAGPPPHPRLRVAPGHPSRTGPSWTAPHWAAGPPGREGDGTLGSPCAPRISRAVGGSVLPFGGFLAPEPRGRVGGGKGARAGRGFRSL